MTLCSSFLYRLVNVAADRSITQCHFGDAISDCQVDSVALVLSRLFVTYLRVVNIRCSMSIEFERDMVQV